MTAGSPRRWVTYQKQGKRRRCGTRPIFRLYSRRMTAGVRKTVAAFVLIWAFADLTVPGLCQADDNKIDSNDSLIAVPSQGGHSQALSPAGIPTPDPDGCPDECFCCSRHASPTSVFDHHASSNLGVTAACAVAASAVSIPLPMTAHQIPLVERRRSHSVSSDILVSPLRC
jgi:hypothetical protein